MNSDIHRPEEEEKRPPQETCTLAYVYTQATYELATLYVQTQGL